MLSRPNWLIYCLAKRPVDDSRYVLPANFLFCLACVAALAPLFGWLVGVAVIVAALARRRPQLVTVASAVHAVYAGVAMLLFVPTIENGLSNADAVRVNGVARMVFSARLLQEAPPNGRVAAAPVASGVLREPLCGWADASLGVRDVARPPGRIIALYNAMLSTPEALKL